MWLFQNKAACFFSDQLGHALPTRANADAKEFERKPRRIRLGHLPTLGKSKIFRNPCPSSSSWRSEWRDVSFNLPQRAGHRYCMTARHRFPSCCDFIKSRVNIRHRRRVITKTALPPNQNGNVISTSSKGY